MSGSEVGSLTERNNLAKGAVEVATNTAEYVEKVASGKKSWQDVAQDAGDAAVSIGTGLYNDYIDPFVKDEKYKQDNLHGGLWTRSVEESYAKGQNEFKKDMVVAEAVLTVYSGGMGTAALKGGKSVAKLDVDLPRGKQPHADVDADGGKGRGGLLHGSGVDDLLEGAPLKDGKLKTKAKLFDDMLKDFDLLTEKYQHNMLKQIFEKIRIKEEVMVDPVFGQSFSVWNISFFKDKKDGHGLQHIETSKGHVSEAPRNKDIPHEITPPKGGKASGDSGHSHHDEPVTDKKGNDANKNQSHEKEKAGAEGTPKADLDKIRETAPDYYKELIDKYGDKGRYYARSPEEYESLAKDPAKNFKINEKSKIERLAGLELEARGDLPGPIVRDTNPAGAEFIDATGVKWDVKGWYSKFAPKGYTLEKAIADIEESLSKGENVIIDSSKMFPEHIDEVREAVKELGLSDKLLWWP